MSTKNLAPAIDALISATSKSIVVNKSVRLIENVIAKQTAGRTNNGNKKNVSEYRALEYIFIARQNADMLHA